MKKKFNAAIKLLNNRTAALAADSHLIHMREAAVLLSAVCVLGEFSPLSGRFCTYPVLGLFLFPGQTVMFSFGNS